MKITIEAEETDVHRVCAAGERIVAHLQSNKLEQVERFVKIAGEVWSDHFKPPDYPDGDPSPGAN